jgi:hypothetical protein
MLDALADINVQYLVAGFMGGIVHAFRLKKATPWEVIGYIVAGGLTANYFTPQLLRFMPHLPAGLTAFMIGYGGFRICRVADKYLADSWNPFGKTENE